MNAKRRPAGRPTPEAFLAGFPPHVRETAERLRSVVRDAVPDAAEAVYPGWKLIGYRLTDRPGGRYFCFVAPLADQARLGFEYGVLLNGGAGLLEGDGTQVRYVSVRSPSDVDPERLVPLVREAARVAAEPKPPRRRNGT